MNYLFLVQDFEDNKDTIYSVNSSSEQSAKIEFMYKFCPYLKFETWEEFIYMITNGIDVYSISYIGTEDDIIKL